MSEILPKKPINPEAARLANYYVPLIRKQCGWHTPTNNLPKESHELTGNLPAAYQELAKQLEEEFKGKLHFQESPKEWEFDESDLSSLEELPL